MTPFNHSGGWMIQPTWQDDPNVSPPSNDRSWTDYAESTLDANFGNLTSGIFDAPKGNVTVGTPTVTPSVDVTALKASFSNNSLSGDPTTSNSNPAGAPNNAGLLQQVLGNGVQGGPAPGPGQLASLGQYAVATVDPRTGATTLLVSSDSGPIYAPASYNGAANAAAASASWNPSWFKSEVQGGGPWDYKRMDPSYENLGNFNYGLTGAAFGFPTGVLLREAGAVQIASGTSNPAWGTPGIPWMGVGGSGSFGDDPRDQRDIRTGINTQPNSPNVTTVRVGWFGPPGG